MEQQEKDWMFFMDSIRDFDVREHPQSVLHILCTRGSMSFRFQNINYNIVAGDYVILANMSLAFGFSEPVIKLSPYDFRKCVCDMERLRKG